MQALGTPPLEKKKKIQINPVIVLRICQILVWIIVLCIGFLAFIVRRNYKELDTLTTTLLDTTSYPSTTDTIRASISTANSDPKNQFLRDMQGKKNLFEIVEMNNAAEKQVNETQKYFDTIQLPYDSLLDFYLMPPLNIWKNRFNGQIDVDLIGQKYLQENKYLDVNLISQWTNFFKDIGRDSPKNEIKNITINEIVENPSNWMFILPITLDFSSETKRSFLLLVDKISMTSNKENLWLLNEFFFNIWLTLEEKNQEAAWATMSSWSGDATTWTVSSQTWWIMADSKSMWTAIYNWVNDPTSDYLTEEDIVKTIKRFANCEKEDMSVCYFKFREKMRNLPALAYTIGMQNTNKVNEFRSFLKELPPLISIESFNFERINTSSTRETNRGYEWSLTIEVYGRSMTQAEIDEISVYLWQQCLWEVVPMSPWLAIAQLDRTIKQATQITQISNEKSKQLNDLRASLNTINQSYATLPWLKRVVKLFEVYRMLQDNRLCVSK